MPQIGSSSITGAGQARRLRPLGPTAEARKGSCPLAEGPAAFGGRCDRLCLPNGERQLGLVPTDDLERLAQGLAEPVRSWGLMRGWSGGDDRCHAPPRPTCASGPLPPANAGTASSRTSLRGERAHGPGLAGRRARKAAAGPSRPSAAGRPWAAKRRCWPAGRGTERRDPGRVRRAARRRAGGVARRPGGDRPRSLSSSTLTAAVGTATAGSARSGPASGGSPGPGRGRADPPGRVAAAPLRRACDRPTPPPPRGPGSGTSRDPL